MAGGARPLDRLDRGRQRPLERVEPVGEPARPGMEVDRVDGQRMLGGRRERLVEPLETDAELRRPVAAVLEVVVVAGARARIDTDPDRRARRAAAIALDLADRVEVEVDAVRQQHVEVALGDVRAGVADLVGPPAALERAQHLAGRAGVDTDCAGLAGRAERRGTPRAPRERGSP